MGKRECEMLRSALASTRMESFLLSRRKMTASISYAAKFRWLIGKEVPCPPCKGGVIWRQTCCIQLLSAQLSLSNKFLLKASRCKNHNSILKPPVIHIRK